MRLPGAAGCVHKLSRGCLANWGRPRAGVVKRVSRPCFNGRLNSSPSLSSAPLLPSAPPDSSSRSSPFPAYTSPLPPKSPLTNTPSLHSFSHSHLPRRVKLFNAVCPFCHFNSSSVGKFHLLSLHVHFEIILEYSPELFLRSFFFFFQCIGHPFHSFVWMFLYTAWLPIPGFTCLACRCQSDWPSTTVVQSQILVKCWLRCCAIFFRCSWSWMTQWTTGLQL